MLSLKARLLKLLFNYNTYNFTRKAYTLASIDINLLKASGIHGVILDLDNTIISEDDRYLSWC